MEINKYPENQPKGAKKNKNFLVIYGLTLLAAALLLIIVSYMMQMRTARQDYQNLQDEHLILSESTKKSIDELNRENELIRAKYNETILKNEQLAQQSSALEQSAAAELAAEKERARLLAADLAAADFVALMLKTELYYEKGDVTASAKCAAAAESLRTAEVLAAAVKITDYAEISALYEITRAALEDR